MLELQRPPPEVFFKKAVLENFANFTGKHLCQILIQNKVATLLKKGTLAQVFSCEFYKISKNTFFTEHFWTNASILQVNSTNKTFNEL